VKRIASTLLLAVALVACGNKPPRLDRIALVAADVRTAAGEDVTAVTGHASRSLVGPSAVTLDQCKAVYRSEAKRSARYLVGFVNAADLLVASNEVVRYKSDGADESYRELRAANKHCAPRDGTADVAVTPPDRRLATRQLTWSFAQGQPDRAPVFAVSVYQWRGDVLYAVHVFRSDRIAAIRLARELAVRGKAKLYGS
jgi:hypothetical protein